MHAVACLSAFVAVIFLQFLHTTDELIAWHKRKTTIALAM